MVGQKDHQWRPGIDGVTDGVLRVASQAAELNGDASRDISFYISAMKVHRTVAAGVTVYLEPVIPSLYAALRPLIAICVTQN